jgi:hypothetical protein
VLGVFSKNIFFLIILIFFISALNKKLNYHFLKFKIF